MTPGRSRTLRLLTTIAALTLLATACGGGGSGQSGEEQDAAATLAQQNEPQLALSNDLSRTELLDVRSGEITNLSEVVVGDRPVLVWYWAPH